jgi:hypothetical protein
MSLENTITSLYKNIKILTDKIKVIESNKKFIEPEVLNNVFSELFEDIEKINNNDKLLNSMIEKINIIKKIQSFSKSNIHNITNLISGFKSKTVFLSEILVIVNSITKNIEINDVSEDLELSLEKLHNPLNILCIYKEKEEDVDIFSDNSNNINIYWINNINSFCTVINKNIVCGNILDINNNISSKDYKFYKKCIKCENGNIKSSCKYLHDDITLFKNICSSLSPGKKDIINKSLEKIMNKDKFYIFEKKLMHDILIHQIFYKFFYSKEKIIN